jgi:3-oxoacyl-ACP reductase-like protein
MNDNEKPEDQTSISAEKLEECMAVLSQLVDHAEEIFHIPIAQRTELIKLAGQLSRPDRDTLRQRKKDGKIVARRKQETQDRTARKETGIRSAREASIFIAPKMLGTQEIIQIENQMLSSPKQCYICKEDYTQIHHYYDTMCLNCGDFNYAKRFQTADVTGQIAVVTGSRLKIGYHICLMLLRGGATVIATMILRIGVID